VKRPVSAFAVVFGLACIAVGGFAPATEALADFPFVLGYSTSFVVSKVFLVVGVTALLYGVYGLIYHSFSRAASKRRAHDARNILRLLFGVVWLIATLGVLTEYWVGLLFSFGVLGFAVTFALQQPLLSLIAWVYIMVKRPYSVGDRVRIGEAKGDVIEVDFLVTTLWEINGELVSSNQPSGRVVTVPNSLVLSSEVMNFGGGGSSYVWNEISIQIAYETDLQFARELMTAEANAILGDEMAEHIAAYREALAETPVEMEVHDRPSVNVDQQESWVQLRLRYLTHPRKGQQVKNELYERILTRFNEHPDRVAFPVSRSR